MNYPSFFDAIDPIVLQDDLARFVGINDNGRIEISYLDVVKMAGHSCLVVSGAFLAARKGLEVLYGSEIPKRGEIRVELQRGPTRENAGVVGSVLSFITGATTDNGFGGLPNGQFNRRHLLIYEAPIDTDIRLTRMDTLKVVGINYRPEKVVRPEEIFGKAFGPKATPEGRKAFPKEFQKMVKTIFDRQDTVIEIYLI